MGIDSGVGFLQGFLQAGASTLGGVTPAMQHKDMLGLPTDRWRLVTDAVMGGKSRGDMRSETRDGRECVCLSGDVSTRNDGGFIQLALDLDDAIARRAADFSGIRLDVLGNGESYNLHLRTADLWLPWQSYRASFVTTSEWRSVQLPFTTFRPYKTGASLRPARLKRIGVVAIGRPFAAAICIAGLGFYN